MLFVIICENSGKDHRGAAGPDTEVSVIGIRLLPVGVVMCDRPARVFGRLAFSDLSVALR